MRGDTPTNDRFWSGYGGPRRITSVSVGSVGGTVSVSPVGQSNLCTPPDEAFGKETFIYVVDDARGKLSGTGPADLGQGPIELHKNGNNLWFKNIYVRELGSDSE